MESAIFTSDKSIIQIKTALQKDEIPCDQHITEEIIKQSKEMIIEDIEGSLFQNRNNKINGNANKKKEININASGFIDNSLKINRNTNSRNDGVCYFWLQQNSNVSDADIVLPFEMDDYKTHHLFAIYFFLLTKKYYIKFNSNDDSSTLIKYSKLFHIQIPIGVRMKLDRITIININHAYFQINFIANDNVEVTDCETNKKFIFNPYAITRLKFGKGDSCTIKIDNDPLISDIHSVICYEKSSRSWYIEDGDGVTPSKVGTFIFGAQSFELFSGMRLMMNGYILGFHYKK